MIRIGGIYQKKGGGGMGMVWTCAELIFFVTLVT